MPLDCRTVRLVANCLSNYTLIDDTIFFNGGDGDSRPRILVPSGPWRDDLLASMHDHPTAGHVGADKLFHRLRLRYYWPGMYKSCEKYVQSCPNCITHTSPPKINKNPIFPYDVAGPFDRVHVDVAGPLTTTRMGNKYIVVFTDAGTKWVEAFATPNSPTSTVIADLLINEIICRYGCPRMIVSDNASIFVSELILTICKMMGIAKASISSYHPESNGQVERMNRTLAAMLSKQICSKHDNWDDY